MLSASAAKNRVENAFARPRRRVRSKRRRPPGLSGASAPTPKEGKAQGAAAAPTGGFKLSRLAYMKKKDGSGD